jgi:glucose/arabinose dehydrogenase
MQTSPRVVGILLPVGVAFWFVLAAADGAPQKILTGEGAFAGYPDVKPGVFRKITAESLPDPYATKSASNGPNIVARPADAWPRAPRGFKVELYATGLNYPRSIRTAPNGDIFLADAQNHRASGAIKVIRGIGKDGHPQQTSTFASGLRAPFGIAFYPPGPNPHWVYIGNTDSVIRLPYKNGDSEATGPAETIIPELPRGGHETRDLAFSADGARMFVAVGSGSNVDDPDTHPRETRRANILEYTPAGQFIKIYASGIRNPVGIAINPLTRELWCSVNERDELGDNLVPDYITHVQEGSFYGWPWYYIGGHQDPRHEGAHPELRSRVTVPDVLLNPHSASLEMLFYDGKQFPKEYRGDIFAAEHGSWNKSVRAGYEVVRVPLDKGHAGGEYEDFLTGFVTEKGAVWGRPAGVAVAPDGSLMVTDDASKSIWRVIYVGESGK